MPRRKLPARPGETCFYGARRTNRNFGGNIRGSLFPTGHSNQVDVISAKTQNISASQSPIGGGLTDIAEIRFNI